MRLPPVLNFDLQPYQERFVIYAAGIVNESKTIQIIFIHQSASIFNKQGREDSSISESFFSINVYSFSLRPIFHGSSARRLQPWWGLLSHYYIHPPPPLSKRFRRPWRVYFGFRREITNIMLFIV